MSNVSVTYTILSGNLGDAEEFAVPYAYHLERLITEAVERLGHTADVDVSVANNTCGYAGEPRVFSDDDDAAMAVESAVESVQQVAWDRFFDSREYIEAAGAK